MRVPDDLVDLATPRGISDQNLVDDQRVVSKSFENRPPPVDGEEPVARGAS
jgi:hypothetical protein